jgi:zinc protease
MQSLRILLISFGMLATTHMVFGQIRHEHTDTLTSNQNLVTGKLPNGFSYFIVKNKQLRGITEINFINKVGFPDESTTEIHFAHLIEHLAFRSTAHFPEGVDGYLKAKGLDPTRDFHGQTGGATSYEFQLRAFDRDLFNSTLLAVRDIASGEILFTKENFEQERAAVLNEIARGDNRLLRSIKENIYNVFNQNPKYNLTLTEEAENVRKASIQSVRSFYEKWYRPKFQSLIVIGDVDQNVVRQQIEQLFGNLTSRGSDPIIRTKGEYDVSLNGKNKVIVNSNGTKSSDIDITVLIMRKHMSLTSTDVNGIYRSQLLDRVCNMLLAERFSSIPFDDEMPTRRISSGIRRHIYHPLANIDAIETSLKAATPDKVLEALDSALFELQRIRLWGFTETEFDLAKKIIAIDIADEYKNSGSDLSVKMLLQAVKDGSALPQQNKLSNPKTIFDSISLDEVNSMLMNWLNEGSGTTVILSVDDSNVLDTRSISSQILQEIISSKQQNLPRHTSRRNELPPVPTTSKPYKILKSDRSGTCHILLDNQIKVIFKPAADSILSPGRNLEIRVLGYDTTGNNLAISDLTYQSNKANRIGKIATVGNLTHAEFQEWMRIQNRTGRLDVAPYVTKFEHGINGSTILIQYEKLLMLIYHYFTTMTLPKNAIRELTDAKKGDVRGNPYLLVQDSIALVISPRKPGKNNAVSDETLLIHLSKLCKETFSNHGNLTFVIVGHFNLEDIVKTTTEYLGAIPFVDNSTRTGQKAKSFKQSSSPNSMPFNATNLTVIDDSVGNASVRMIFSVSGADNELEFTKLRILNEILRARLWQRMRVEEKAVYSVSSSIKYRSQIGFYAFDVAFETDMKKIETMRTLVVDEFAKLTNSEPDSSEFRNSLEFVRSEIDQQFDHIGYWISYIKAAETHRALPRTLEQVKSMIDNLTPQDLRIAARKMIEIKRHCFFTII